MFISRLFKKIMLEINYYEIPSFNVIHSLEFVDK